MASVKRVTVARFMELAAAEGISPDFDRFRPCDVVILILFTDGTAAAFPVGERFIMDF